MLGIWKSFDELEESISLEELDFILKEKRAKEKRERFFLAGIQGVDWGKYEEPDREETNDTYEEVKRRAAARLAGGEEELDRQELADLGFGFKTV